MTEEGDAGVDRMKGEEATATFLQDVSSVEGVNQAVIRLHNELNDLRDSGVSEVRVAVVEVDDER